MSENTKSDNARVALISGVVAIVVALISTYGTIAAKQGELRKASQSANSVNTEASKTLEKIEEARLDLTTGLYQTIYSENRQFIRSEETIPWDDTIPQQGEGTRVLSVNVTPKSKSGCLVVNAIVHAVEEVNSADHIVVALFKDTEPDAIFTATSENWGQLDQFGGGTTTIPLYAVIPVSSSAPIRLTLRAGLNSGAININGSNNTRRLGGSLASSITVTEVAPCAMNSR